MKIVQEYAPGQFRLWGPALPVSKTCNRQVIRIYREGVGLVAEYEEECEPYEAVLSLSSIAGWTDDELAACKLYLAVPFVMPEGKAQAEDGDIWWERGDDGVVREFVPVEDAPPPPPELSKAEIIAQMFAERGLTLDDLREVLVDKDAKGSR